MEEFSLPALEQIGVTPAFRGDLPTFRIHNLFADAEVSPYGAHILSYIPKDQPDLLWVSGKSNFTNGKPIRGGIPVCWPWFGPAGTPAHGVARIVQWAFRSARMEADGSTTLVFFLDKSDERGLNATLSVNIGPALSVFLTTKNVGMKAFPLSEALHTYFAVSDISKVTVHGLDREDLPEKDRFFPGFQHGVVHFQQETDLVCQVGDKILTVCDGGLGRTIRLERFGSASAVVWNPWIEKAKRMPDYGDEEYHSMVCVEAANARDGALVLNSGVTHTLGMRISLV